MDFRNVRWAFSSYNPELKFMALWRDVPRSHGLWLAPPLHAMMRWIPMQTIRSFVHSIAAAAGDKRSSVKLHAASHSDRGRNVSFFLRPFGEGNGNGVASAVTATSSKCCCDLCVGSPAARTRRAHAL